MKKQVLFVHGGFTSGNYEDFLGYLKTRTIWDLSSDPVIHWNQKLRQFLGSDYEVFSPKMPNSQNAVYEEWKIWFERHFEFLHDDAILVGWSLGGTFLAKYLSENKLPFRCGALFLISAVETFEVLDSIGTTSFSFNNAKLENITKQISTVHIYHSKDDSEVPYNHALAFQSGLVGSHLHTFEDRGHFLQEEFPELVEEIRGVG